MLELACGSGEITRKLHQDGFELTALDLSAQMIEKALEKSPEITFLCRDMKDLSGLPMYPAIACLCDSFNYILSEQEVEDFLKKWPIIWHRTDSFLRYTFLGSTAGVCGRME